MMKTSKLIPALILCAFAIFPVSGTDPAPKVTKLSDGSRVVNTTGLCTVKGFRGPVPLEVTVKKGNIVKVTALPNKESPAYFKKVTDSGLLRRWNGMTLKQASKAKVDAVSGATYSSRSVIANVKAAADYLIKNGK